MKKKTKIIVSILCIFIVFLILSSVYFNYENTKLQISKYNIVNKLLPYDFNNYKIVQISDFHNTKSKSLTTALIKSIGNCRPNIIVFTGDLIDSNKTDIDVAIEFVKAIKDIAPIYFVSGNHEASINRYAELKEKLRANNVIILDNQTVTLKQNLTEINLIGINDPKMAHESMVEDSDIVKVELDGICDKNKFSILLSHRPELFDTYVEKELDLVLTGHAHGGQIRLPFIGGMIAPNQGLFPKYTSGVFQQNKTSMIVSRGIGNSILPFRINNRPELVVVTLKNA